MRARCSSMVECPLMMRWVDESIPHGEPISHSCQCSTNGVTKAVVCTVLFVGWCIQKIPCCYLERVAYEAVAAGFLSRCLSGLLPHA